jgi:hypothetical protein
MSLYSAQIALAAKTAQIVLAPLTDESGEAGVFTLGGTDYTGVFYEVNATDPLDPTGVRCLRQLTIHAEASQFASAPSAHPRTTLTAKGRTWTLTSTTDLPNHYRLTCRPV